jgi:hypothetical protein
MKNILTKKQFYEKWEAKLRDGGITGDLTNHLESLWNQYKKFIKENKEN